MNGLTAVCWLVIFISVWGLVASFGGEWTKRTVFDIFASVVFIALAVCVLTLQAAFG